MLNAFVIPDYFIRTLQSQKMIIHKQKLSHRVATIGNFLLTEWFKHKAASKCIVKDDEEKCVSKRDGLNLKCFTRGSRRNNQKTKATKEKNKL